LYVFKNNSQTGAKSLNQQSPTTFGQVLEQRIASLEVHFASPSDGLADWLGRCTRLSVNQKL
jgi:hypothetical protein